MSPAKIVVVYLKPLEAAYEGGKAMSKADLCSAINPSGRLPLVLVGQPAEHRAADDRPAQLKRRSVMVLIGSQRS